MKKTKAPTINRTKARFNAYLPHELVSWGEAYAAKAFKSARRPDGLTLSALIERLIAAEKKKVERRAARRAAISAN